MFNLKSKNAAAEYVTPSWRLRSIVVESVLCQSNPNAIDDAEDANWKDGEGNEPIF